MKTKISLPLACLVLFLLQSFILPVDNYKNYELKKNETIVFNSSQKNKPEKISASYKRWSYDHSRYAIEIDTAIHLTVSNITAAEGKHQNELSIILCSGTFTRNEDTLKVHATTYYDKLYLFSVEKNGIIDSLTSEVQIAFVSKTLKNEYCPNLVTTGTFTGIVALPKNIDPDEIYKPEHEDHTVGVFTYFKVIDANGKSREYPMGDYVLIGGNSISFSNKITE